jgi:hypothetical protein
MFDTPDTVELLPGTNSISVPVSVTRSVQNDFVQNPCLMQAPHEEMIEEAFRLFRIALTMTRRGKVAVKQHI